VNLQHGSAHLLSQGFFAQANASSLRDVQMLVGNSPLSITPPYIGFIHTLGAVCSSDALAHAGKRFWKAGDMVVPIFPFGDNPIWFKLLIVAIGLYFLGRSMRSERFYKIGRFVRSLGIIAFILTGLVFLFSFTSF
jgi:hypothetical protein